MLQIIIPDGMEDFILDEVRIGLISVPTGSAVKIDIRKNGSDTTDSIFTSDAEIEIATSASTTNGMYLSGCDDSGSTVGTAGTTIDSARNTMALDDMLYAYITQVGSSVPGADLLITMNFSLGTPAGTSSAVAKERLVVGPVTTGALMPIIVPDSWNGKTLSEVRLSLTGLPVGSALKVDIRKNGTATTDSVFTSDVEIEVGTGQSATNGVYMTGCDDSASTVGTSGTTLDSARNTLATDDMLYVYVTEVGSTTSGTDLTVSLSIL